VAELRIAIEGGENRWSVCHGVEVGSGSVRRGNARGEAAMLNRLMEEEGITPSPPPPRVGQFGHMGCAGRLGQKAEKNSFKIK
jgi:hypothetical protein